MRMRIWIRLSPRFAVEAREAIKVHLAALFTPEAAEPETTEESTCDEPQPADTSSPRLPTPLPTPISEEQREELAVDNAARHDWIAEGGRQQRDVSGSYQRTADFRISTTDPDATPMRLKGGGTHLGYHTHYVVDGGKRRIILAVLVTPGEVMDNHPMLDLLWHVHFRWRLRPQHVTGDTKYGTIENIKAIEDAHIRAYVPLPDWEHKTSYYGPAQFTYDAVQDQYRCPQGQLLFPFHREEPGPTRGIPCSCGHLQCLPRETALYFKQARSALASVLFCGLSGAREGVPSDLGLPESHEQAQSLGRTALCGREGLAWDAAFSPPAALASQL